VFLFCDSNVENNWHLTAWLLCATMTR